jgi:heme o synthase
MGTLAGTPRTPGEQRGLPIAVCADAAPLDRGASKLRAALAGAADCVRLTKPRITTMVIVTALGGMWLAARTGAAAFGPGDWLRAVSALLGLALVVGAANALNMYIERASDALMERTRTRPLPAGRMRPGTAIAVGVSLAVIGVPMLVLAAGALAATLATVALVLYVAVYTPLKRVTPLALVIGAIPGAMPPLVGWTAASGSMDWPGVALFGVLFFWQMPHFLAIATFRRTEYERAGIRVLPSVRGDRVTRIHVVLYALGLVATSLALVPLGVRGPVYVINAIALGAVFLGICVLGLRPLLGGARAAAGEGDRWARALFAVSLVYLPLLIAAMMVSA